MAGGDGLERGALLEALRRLRDGDFAARLPEGVPGADAEIARAFNEAAAMNEALARQLRLASKPAPADAGGAGEQARVAAGAWRQCLDAVEALALSSRYKSEFLANMSHELRTPLNSLLILARLLSDNREGNLTPRQVEFAQTIHASGNDLLSLINDILDLAKIESGTVTLNIAPERFGDLRDFVERNFRQVAIDKGLEFSISIDAALPAAIETDAKRLQQILKNLLSNAFKFTPQGGVSLRIGPAPGSSSGVAFSVVDTGIGIEAGKQRVIFEAFQQADGTTSREYGGTGLGLSISRELARLLGGEIRVESAPGRGSVFMLLLPLESAPARDDPPVFASGKPAPLTGVRQPPPSPSLVMPAQPQVLARPSGLPVAGPRVADPGVAARLAGRQVLIVDDDIRNVFALTSALEQHGMKVLHAESGKEAIDLLQKAQQVDALLMDVMMPGLDGYDTIRIVRRQDRWKQLPILAVTAKAMMGDREKCLAAGANDYVAKPVDMDLLMAKLADSLERAGAAI